MKRIETVKSGAFMLQKRDCILNFGEVERMSLEEAMQAVISRYEPWYSGVMLSFGDDRFFDLGKVVTEEGDVYLDTAEVEDETGVTFYVVACLQKNGNPLCDEEEIARLFWKKVGKNSWLLKGSK